MQHSVLAKGQIQGKRTAIETKKAGYVLTSNVEIRNVSSN